MSDNMVKVDKAFLTESYENVLYLRMYTRGVPMRVSMRAENLYFSENFSVLSPSSWFGRRDGVSVREEFNPAFVEELTKGHFTRIGWYATLHHAKYLSIRAHLDISFKGGFEKLWPTKYGDVIRKIDEIALEEISRAKSELGFSYAKTCKYVFDAANALWPFVRSKTNDIEILSGLLSGGEVKISGKEFYLTSEDFEAVSIVNRLVANVEEFLGDPFKNGTIPASGPIAEGSRRTYLWVENLCEEGERVITGDPIHFRVFEYDRDRATEHDKETLKSMISFKNSIGIAPTGMIVRSHVAGDPASFSTQMTLRRLVIEDDGYKRVSFFKPI